MSHYYVSTLGNDTGPGTIGSPWLTLQKAAAAAVAGDTVTVMVGTYNAGMNLFGHAGGTVVNPISFLADAGVVLTHCATTGPNASTAAIVVELSGGGFIFDGFGIVSDGSMTKAGIRISNAPDCIVRNCNVAGAFTGIFASVADGVLVEDNVCHGSTDQHGIYVNGTNGYRVLRNECYGNPWDGIHLNILDGATPGSPGYQTNLNGLVEANICHGNTLSGLDIDGCRNTVFRNNVVYGNDKHGFTLYNANTNPTQTCQNLTIVNNICFGNGMFSIQVIPGNDEGLVIFNNILLDGTSGAYGAIGISGAPAASFRSNRNAVLDRFSTGLAVGPVKTLAQWRTTTGQDTDSFVTSAAAVFTNPVTFDLTHKVAGTALNAGVGGFAGRFTPVSDFLGVNRPQGSSIDLGAYEVAVATVAPSAPSGPSALPVDPLSIQLSWTPNGPNASSAIIQRSLDGVTGWVIAQTVAAGTSVYVDSGRTTGVTYYYRIQNVNWVGASAYSAIVSAVGPASPTSPAAPTSLTAVAGGWDRIQLTWVDNAANETAYHVERSSDGGATYAEIASLPAGSAGYLNTDLTPTQKYVYRVRAENTGAYSAYSNAAVAITSLLAVGSYQLFSNSLVPASPNSTDGNPINVGLKFRPSVSGRVTGVRFYKGTLNTGIHTGFLWGPDGAQLATVVFSGETASGWQEQDFLAPINVTAGQTYKISVHMASGYFGFTDSFFDAPETNGPLYADIANSWFLYYDPANPTSQSPSNANYWTDVVFETVASAPEAPTGLVASSPGSVVNLSWIDNSSNETGFKVERSIDNITFAPLGTVSFGETRYSDSTGVMGVTYYYRVRSTNGMGDSAPMLAVSGVISGAPPTIPDVVDTPGQLPSRKLVFTYKRGNPPVLTNLDGPPVLSNDDATFGVRRLDTGAKVVDALTPFVQATFGGVPQVGTYEYDLGAGLAGINLEYWVVYQYKGVPSTEQRFSLSSLTYANSPFHTYGEFLSRFGAKNIARASNKENDNADADTVAIQMSFDAATEEIYSFLRGVYKIPLDWTPNGGVISPRIKRLAMNLAFEDLYEVRGWSDVMSRKVPDVRNKISRLAQDSYRELALYRAGVRQLPAVLDGKASFEFGSFKTASRFDTREPDERPVTIFGNS